MSNDYQPPDDCKRKEFSAENLGFITDCLPNSWCPREGVGP
jgi:hypothetical protein